MHKIIFWVVVILFLVVGFCFAEEEEFSITTYYPSPYGVYKELRAKKTVIGDINAATTPAPSDGAVTFMPTSQPLTYSKGTLYYDEDEKTYKYYDGQEWQILGIARLAKACVGSLCCQLGTDCYKTGPESGSSCQVGYWSKERQYGSVTTKADGTSICTYARQYAGYDIADFGCAIDAISCTFIKPD